MLRTAHILGCWLAVTLLVAAASVAHAHSHHHGHHSAAHGEPVDHDATRSTSAEPGHASATRTSARGNAHDRHGMHRHRTRGHDHGDHHDHTNCIVFCDGGMGDCPSVCCAHDLVAVALLATDRKLGCVVLAKASRATSLLAFAATPSLPSARSPPDIAVAGSMPHAWRAVLLRRSSRIRI